MIARTEKESPESNPVPRMHDAATNPELMSSLRRLVRGLSALQWGLPLTLFLCVQTGVTDWLRPMGIFPALATTGMLLFGLSEIRHFQKHERVWIQSIERASLFALINFGISPFVYFWNRLPQIEFYNQMMLSLIISGIFFLLSLNRVLQRLAAMLPDETMREDTRLFTSLNINILVVLLMLMASYFVLLQVHQLPELLARWFGILYQTKTWLLIFLILLPVAMTMTLIWKIKDVVMTSVFQRQS